MIFRKGWQAVAAAAIVCGANVANADNVALDIPGFGDGSLLVTVWDDTVSLAYDLGSTFSTFDLNTSMDFGVLPGFTDTFSDLSAVSWTVTAADNQSNGTFVGLSFLTTGFVSTAITNGGVGTVTEAINRYLGDLDNEFSGSQIGCGPDTACIANTSNLSYGGRSTFGETLNLPGLVDAGGAIGDALPFVLVSQIGGFVFSAASVQVIDDVTWSLSADGLLSYTVGGGGGEPVPVPAALVLLLSGLAALGGRARAVREPTAGG